LWSKQVKAKKNAQSSSSNVEENNTFNNPETSNSFKHEKQHEVNKALALNNTLLPHKVSKIINQHILVMQKEVYEVPLAYDINHSIKPNTWDDKAHLISILVL